MPTLASVLSIEKNPQATGASEWNKAQQLQISVNLISAAKEELKFLAVVDATPALKNRRVLERAIDRYLNCWLPLASTCEPGASLLPPLDCAWIWHCHKLNPVQYAKDCNQLFGMIVDVAAAETNHHTITRWNISYPDEPYYFVRTGESRISEESFKPLKNRNTLTYDLVGASERQTPFYFQMCRPWMSEDKFLQAALERYRGFLYVLKRALEKAKASQGIRPFIVPTYDIDLMWHSHQLNPTAYRADTLECMGEILDHDDSDGNRDAGAKLQTSFVDTCVQWLEMFGTVYEHAGSLYRGPEPVRSAPPILDNENPLLVTGYPVNQNQQPILEGNEELFRRESLQVNLVLLGARNVNPEPKPGRMTYLYVRVTALRKCPGMKLTTNPVPCSSDSTAYMEWNEGFSLEAEVSTVGLRLELLSYTSKTDNKCSSIGCLALKKNIPMFKKNVKCLGEIFIDWEKDLRSTSGLSFSNWVSMMPQCSETSQPKYKSKISATQIFRVDHTPNSCTIHFPHARGPVTDDKGLQISVRLPADGVRQDGRWLTRTVVDHSGREEFVVRTRWSKGVARDKFSPPTRVTDAETVIKVHPGPFRTLNKSETRNYHDQNLVQAPAAVVGIARQMVVTPTENVRKWSLFEGSAFLDVARPTSYGRPLECQLQGYIGYPVKLLGGRWLEYEVQARRVDPAKHDREEAKYLTLIRYTPDAPAGKATALINLQSSAIEVKPEESVVLVLLLSTAVSKSLFDMDYSTPRSRKKGKRSTTDGHLGAMQLQRNGLSARWNRRPSDQNLYWEGNSANLLLFSLFWWELSSAQIYATGAFGGSVCGGGACGGAACGGGGCATSGGGCGGGCASGGGCGG